MTFLAAVCSPLPSSHVVYPVFFLNSATKNNFRSGVTPSPLEGVTSFIPLSDATAQDIGSLDKKDNTGVNTVLNTGLNTRVNTGDNTGDNTCLLYTSPSPRD